MVDLQGAKARLRPNSQRAAAEIEDEFDENRWESQEALKYLGFLKPFSSFDPLSSSLLCQIQTNIYSTVHKGMCMASILLSLHTS